VHLAVVMYKLGFNLSKPTLGWKWDNSFGARDIAFLVPIACLDHAESVSNMAS
jgi:hypothetical protein